MNVYVCKRAAGADPATSVEWTEVCQTRRSAPFLWVTQRTTRDTSRWTTVVRKRQFVVESSGSMTELSSHYTLEAAIKAAHKFAKEKSK
jgi:hypothetical protein